MIRSRGPELSPAAEKSDAKKEEEEEDPSFSNQAGNKQKATLLSSLRSPSSCAARNMSGSFPLPP